MTDFHQFGLPQPLLQALSKLGYQTPTPIQQQAIPLILEGKDILGTAQTGTGKTAAFGLPLLANLLASNEGSALVVTPTRELATQVMTALRGLLGPSTGIKTALMIGGESMGKQLNELRQRPRLYVGTPGRINDHLKRGTLKLSDTRMLVLDETDRMLDMGFSVQIDEILKHMPKQKQTLLFSATMPPAITKMAASYLNKPERIAIGETSKPAPLIKQDILHLAEGEKYPQLLAQIEQRDGSIIIFVKTKYNAEKMSKRLRAENHDSDALHGDLRHNKRERVIKNFRDRKYRILVATDIAARGLDIPHIEHVINYDLPQCPEDYIHRIGRTARAGAEGSALCFVTPSDKDKWFAIHRLLNPQAAAAEKKVWQGSKKGPSSGDFKGKSNGQKKPFRFGKKPAQGGKKRPSFAKKKAA